MWTRRGFLRAFLGSMLAGFGGGAYAMGVEPFNLRLARYRVTPAGWPKDFTLRIAAVTDIHACRPWMTAERIRWIASRTNRVGADLIVLLGDYSAGHKWVTGDVHSAEWAPALGSLHAPLGTFAILGNHDWWEDRTAQTTGHGPTFGRRALEHAGIRVLENDALRLEHEDRPFWLAGLGDQLALLPWRRYGRSKWQGMDDLPGTLAQVTDDAPVVLLAHEPDIFPQVPARVALTLAGHTHGGQVRLLGHSPVVPSRYGNRYAYGHVREARPGGTTDLIVSGGLGCSIAPVRIGVPPEILVVDLGRPILPRPASRGKVAPAG